MADCPGVKNFPVASNWNVVRSKYLFFLFFSVGLLVRGSLHLLCIHPLNTRGILWTWEFHSGSVAGQLTDCRAEPELWQKLHHRSATSWSQGCLAYQRNPRHGGLDPLDPLDLDPLGSQRCDVMWNDSVQSNFPVSMLCVGNLIMTVGLKIALNLAAVLLSQQLRRLLSQG